MIVSPVVWTSGVLFHCTIRAIAIKKSFGGDLAQSGTNYATTPLQLRQRDWKVREVIGVPNGILVLAVSLAKHYGLKASATASDSKTQLVVCDDILDTGKSIRLTLRRNRAGRSSSWPCTPRSVF